MAGTMRRPAAGAPVRSSATPRSRRPPIAPGLRDPGAMPRSGSGRTIWSRSELANDLDRWRTDRPLAFADEPFWGQTVPRWLRHHRRTLIDRGRLPAHDRPADKALP